MSGEFRWIDWAKITWLPSLCAGLLLAVCIVEWRLEQLCLLGGALLLFLGGICCFLGAGKRALVVLFCLGAGALLGYGRYTTAQRALWAQPLRELQGTKIALRGRWDGLPKYRRDCWIGIFVADSVLTSSAGGKQSVKTSEPWRDLPSGACLLLKVSSVSLPLDSYLEVRGVVRPIANSRTFPSKNASFAFSGATGELARFDAVSYYGERGVWQQMRTSCAVGVLEAPQWRDRVIKRVNAVRRYMERTMLDNLPMVPAELLLGISLGESYRLAPEIAADFRSAGLSHMLAASGLHVGLVLGTLFFVGKLAGVASRRMVVPDMAAVWLYAALVGFSPSVVRAMLMSGVAMLALANGRPVSLGRSLMLAVVVAFFWQPLAVREVGFQLSYAAVWGICLWQRWLRERWEQLRLRLNFQSGRLETYLGDSLALTLAVMWGTAPLLVYYFGEFAWVGIVANLFAVPLLGLLLGCGLLACLVQGLHLAGSLWFVVHWLAVILLHIAHYFGNLTVPLRFTPPAVELIAGYYLVGLGIWFIWQGRKRQRSDVKVYLEGDSEKFT